MNTLSFRALVEKSPAIGIKPSEHETPNTCPYLLSIERGRGVPRPPVGDPPMASRRCPYLLSIERGRGGRPRPPANRAKRYNPKHSPARAPRLAGANTKASGRYNPKHSPARAPRLAGANTKDSERYNPQTLASGGSPPRRERIRKLRDGITPNIRPRWLTAKAGANTDVAERYTSKYLSSFVEKKPEMWYNRRKHVCGGNYEPRLS